MGGAWTDSLIDPLATIARDRDWNQIQESRAGGWLLLSADLVGEAGWYQASAQRPELTPLNPLEDAELPSMRRAITQWMRSCRSIELLAWRVGRRAIFRVGSEQGHTIRKIYRRDRNTLRRWTVFEGASQERWRAPRVLDWDSGLNCLTIECCPGVSLNQKWLTGSGQPSDGTRIADLLDWIAAQTPPHPFPRHTSEDESKILIKRLAEHERTLRDPSPRAGLLVQEVVDRLRDTPPGREVLCHRDLHDKQILLEPAIGHLIDLDLAAIGPAALDVGNILAHLRLRALKGAEIPWRQIAERIVERAVPERAIADSLAIWTAAALMRLTLIYSRRRRSPELLERLADSTAQALDRTGEWAGIV